jgi:hypothetical protein
MKILLFLTLTFPIILFAQDSKKTANNSTSNTIGLLDGFVGVVSPIAPNSITVISTISDVTTYSIVNKVVKDDLIFNKTKRDKITSLPGVFELVVSSHKNEMIVKIDVDFADEYLEKYFGENSSNDPTQLNK